MKLLNMSFEKKNNIAAWFCMRAMINIFFIHLSAALLKVTCSMSVGSVSFMYFE